MKKTLVLFAALLLVYGANSQTNKETNFVDVQGSAERYIMPDEIFVQITINENDTKGKQTLAVQEKEMFKTLKNAGIDIEKNLTVMDMSSDYRYFMLRKNDVMVSKDYKLKLSSAKQLSEVVQGLEKVGISNINIISTNYSKMEELKSELRVEAIKYAKTKAVQLSEAIGQSIGQATQINDNDGYATGFMEGNPMPRYAMLATAKNDSAQASTPNLNFEKTKATYRVSARFELLK